MMRVFGITLLLLGICYCQNTDDLDSVRKQYEKDVFEVWKQTSNITSSTPVPIVPDPIVPDSIVPDTTGRECICVEYYNCDPDTNTTYTDGRIDGFGKIDIRFGQGQGASAKKCPHYLDVCCIPALPPDSGDDDGHVWVPGGSGGTGGTGGSGTPGGSGGSGGSGGTGPVVIPTKPPVTPQPPLQGPIQCGIRNPKGLGFTIQGAENHESEYGEFPWMVALMKKGYDSNNVDDNLLFCGGSLIHQQVVLTGAHCVDKYRFNPSEIRVRAGEWDTQTGREQYLHQEKDVQQIIIHEQYAQKTVYNDIALIILKSPVEYAANIKPVCLPRQGEIFNQQECYTTGWGKTSFGKIGKLSVILKKISLPMVEKNKCESDLRKTRLGKHFHLHDSFVCAGGIEGKDACTGDGGGPLVCPSRPHQGHYEQAGIVAWGIGCGQKNVPGVYANVALFRNWIDSHMKRLGYGTQSYTVS